MKYPKVRFITENTGNMASRYLCFLAKSISLKLYQNSEYYVLPKLVTKNSRCVYFPDFAYSKNFWKSIKLNNNKNFCAKFSSGALKEASRFLASMPFEDSDNSAIKIKRDWAKIEPDFWANVFKFLDFASQIAKIDKIEVLLTPFGTPGSFYSSKVGKKFHIQATCRLDSPAGNIAFILLQCLYVIKESWGGEIADEEFARRMEIVNFLFSETVFFKFYPGYKDINKTSFAPHQDDIIRSQKYLEKLGFPANNLTIDSNAGSFTSQEKSLLKYMQKCPGKVVSFDKISQILWGDESYDKYSPQAMAKIIENIRRKIKKLGIKRRVIFTKRGKGYWFN
jgi:hypothetical protein